MTDKPPGCGASDCKGYGAELKHCRTGGACYECTDCGRLTIFANGKWTTWDD